MLVTLPAVSNYQKLATLPVIQKVVALNTNISGVDSLVPIGQSYSFNKASQVVVGLNGVGKSGLMHMLYSSIRNNNYFQENHCSSLAEDFRPYPDLFTKLSKGQLGSRDRNLIANFALENSNNFLFLTHLQQVDPVATERIRTGQSYLLSATSLQKLFNNLKQDTPINRFFYLDLQTTTPAVFPIYQATVTPDDSTKKIKTLPEVGLFNHHYDGRDLRGVENLQHAKYINGVQLENFTFTPGKEEIKLRERALSAGQNAFLDWKITYQKVEQFFQKQEISFPCNKTFLERGFSLPVVGQEVFYSVPADSKLVLIIDEPTPYLDWLSADHFTKELLGLLEKYPGRIQIILATHDRTLMQDLAATSEYFNFMQLPGVLVNDCPRKPNVF